jgi:hypothetical protein
LSLLLRSFSRSLSRLLPSRLLPLERCRSLLLPSRLLLPRSSSRSRGPLSLLGRLLLPPGSRWLLLRGLLLPPAALLSGQAPSPVPSRSAQHNSRQQPEQAG